MESVNIKEISRSPLPEPFKKIYIKAGYQFVGKYGAYKPCYYFRTALTKRIMCYKYWFYGIPTHRCIQWSPILECNQECVFCWRVHRSDLKLPAFRGDLNSIDWDEPEELIDQAIKQYYNTLKSYDPRHHPRVDVEMWKDAMNGPQHLATSLTGEPTMYPKIGELMEIGKKRGMTTFIVTNGTFPEVLEKMDVLPTQLYISLVGPDYKTWARATRPLWNAKEQWNKLLKTLELLPSLNTRTVIRITSVKGLNMINPEGYAKLIRIAEPDFVEPKGYTWVGRSRERLPNNSVPTMDEIREFARQINKFLGYKYIDEVERARIVLLWNEKTPLEIHPKRYKNVKR